MSLPSTIPSTGKSCRKPPSAYTTKGSLPNDTSSPTPTPTSAALSVELISNRYQLSKYHSKGQKIVTDEERLYELVPILMINFKYAIVCEELKHMMFALQDPAIANDEARCNDIMKRYSEMRKIQSIMAKRLGDRVVLP